MSKEKLATAMAEKLSIAKSQAKYFIDTFIDEITGMLKEKDGKVSFIGFGSFAVKERKATEGRNPQTGQKMAIPAKKVIKFTPGASLKDSINNKTKAAAPKKSTTAPKAAAATDKNKKKK